MRRMNYCVKIGSVLEVFKDFPKGSYTRVTTVSDGTQTETMKNALRVVQARNQRRGGGSSMSDAAVTKAGASYLALMRAAERLRHWLAMTLQVGARARARLALR